MQYCIELRNKDKIQEDEDKTWSDVEGSKEYTIKFYRMEFGDTSINVFSVPHQSTFRIGSNPQYWKRRLEAILIALNRSLN